MTANSSDETIVRYVDGSIDIAFYTRRASRLRGLAIADAEDRCVAGARGLAGRAADLVHRCLMAAARPQQH